MSTYKILNGDDFFQSNSLAATFAEFNKIDNDSLWKFFSEHNMDDLAPYVLRAKIRGLDFSKMEFLNKELQNIMPPNLISKRRYVDKLIKIFKKKPPNTFIILHMEFQTEARIGFSERIGKYNIRLRANNDCQIITIVIIHRATASYHNTHLFDKKENGATINYQGYVIADMVESEFALNTCSVSQVFHAIWLYEHNKEYSIEEISAKYLKIIKNIFLLDFKDYKYLSIMLIVIKNASKCLKTLENFRTFAEEIKKLNLNIDPMDAIERLRGEGKAEGIVEGKAEGIVEGIAINEAKAQKRLIEIAKFLFKEGNSMEFIAKALGTDVERLARLLPNN